MINRIKEILLREGLTSGSFADEIGVQRSSLSHILNGRNNPSLDFILKVLQRFPRLNSDWLLVGKGDMYMGQNIENKEDVVNNTVPDLFSTVSNPLPDVKETLDNPETNKLPVNQPVKDEIKERYVSKIFILYSDSTYQEYKPEKPGK